MTVFISSIISGFVLLCTHDLGKLLSQLNLLVFSSFCFGRLGNLRDKLALGKLTNISFLVVNEQDAQSRALYWELKRRTAEGIPVYQQSPLQNDVWDILEGDKDDFLVYDRYGLNTLLNPSSNMISLTSFSLESHDTFVLI